MDAIIKDYRSKLELGQLQTFQNMTAIPLFTSSNHSPEYVTLGEALDRGLITITEISHGGSVPELKVINTSDAFILLLDGEELAGAKQNRVLNTTILVKKRSETTVPVSCTEQGRWSYKSASFSNSGTVLSSRIRSGKTRSVTRSLASSSSYASDQGDVWRRIEHMQLAAHASSPTSAMRDVYTSKAEDLDKYLGAFRCVPHQRGILVFVNREVAGFDVLSREDAYEKIHSKLVKSYAMDALLQRTQHKAEPSVEKALKFLKEITTCKETRFDSVGVGHDYRYESSRAVGSALVVGESVIHMAFFRTDQTVQESAMPGYSRRREYRRRASL